MQNNAMGHFPRFCRTLQGRAEMAQVELQVEFEEKNIIKMIITKKNCASVVLLHLM